MKNIILTTILLSISVSCTSQILEIIDKSTIKLEGQNTNIRDLIEIDGYYTALDYPEYYSSIMFFEDGTWVDFHFKRDLSENERKANMSKSVKSWIEKKQIRWGSYWGVYKIERDTLIVYQYDKSSFWKGWSLNETRYKIIDGKTIHPIYWKSLLKSADSYYRSNSPWKYGSPYSFFPADSLPSSDCWLKEEKWIWRNEPDWRDYMERIKKEKKEKMNNNTE